MIAMHVTSKKWKKKHIECKVRDMKVHVPRLVSSICIFELCQLNKDTKKRCCGVFPWFSQLGGTQWPRWIPSHDDWSWSCQFAHWSTRCFDVLKHTNQEPKKGKSKGQF